MRHRAQCRGGVYAAALDVSGSRALSPTFLRVQVSIIRNITVWEYVVHVQAAALSAWRRAVHADHRHMRERSPRERTLRPVELPRGLEHVVKIRDA